MTAAQEPVSQNLSADEMQARLMAQIQSISDTAFSVIGKCMERHQQLEFDVAVAIAARDALRAGIGPLKAELKDTRLAFSEMRAVLTEIVREYRATYDASNDGGAWKGAAQIDARVMERAERLVSK